METTTALDGVEEHLRAVLFDRPHGVTTEEVLAHADLVAASADLLQALRRLPLGHRFLSWPEVERALTSTALATGSTS